MAANQEIVFLLFLYWVFKLEIVYLFNAAGIVMWCIRTPHID